MGIEPTWPAWKAGALPLRNTRTLTFDIVTYVMQSCNVKVTLIVIFFVNRNFVVQVIIQVIIRIVIWGISGEFRIKNIKNRINTQNEHFIIDLL